MELGFIIRVILEVLAVLLVCYGITIEEKLIEFEDEMFAIIKFCFKKYVLKNQKRTKKTPYAKQQKVVRKKKGANLKVVDGKKKASSRVVA